LDPEQLIHLPSQTRIKMPNIFLQRGQPTGDRIGLCGGPKCREEQAKNYTNSKFNGQMVGGSETGVKSRVSKKKL
jgi:hypothetical protein